MSVSEGRDGGGPVFVRGGGLLDRAAVERAVDFALSILARSERGRKVAADLRDFLDGPVDNLDGDGWEAIAGLLQAFRCGWAGTVWAALQRFAQFGRNPSTRRDAR
jgi:hypothetical protein